MLPWNLTSRKPDNRKLAVVPIKKVKLLVDGNIPANTDCPFKKQCGIALAGNCGHEGKKHSVPYSCALARAFDI